ncbi:helix-turn-helix domain-containing protein [Spirosoma rhododendri]|uniref:Helix-turn-helix transcriptional regulator n=1 Tax=Spirosoma rhododendri TaxID=2728024 RepID=A0A7L5DPG8_9BACT|nr:AraC family transcriptional regulator [Spirosoma rhododendri]QJD80384.1 helix-turn-helix transcriptional regulator [Spirosoma rhododendri]
MIALLMYALAAGAAFLLAFLCLVGFDAKNQLAVRWFGLFLVSVGFALIGSYVWNGGYAAANPYLIVISELPRFAMAPALYLSIWQFTRPLPMKRTQVWPHFIPALLFFLFSLPHLVSGSAPPVTPLLPDGLFRGLGQVLRYSLKLQFIVYWVLSFRLLHRHQRHVLLFAAHTEPIRLTWLYGLLGTIAGMGILWIVQSIHPDEQLTRWLSYPYLIGVFGISYCLVNQEEIFAFSATEKESVDRLLTQADDAQEPARPARLQEAEIAALTKRLDQLLIADRVFTDPDLDLPRLATQMSLSINDLSYLINEGYGVNFFGLVNGLRVDEAKRLLLSPRHRHLSILGVAYEVGFSSKTTFYTAFKKYTGQTPSAFVKANPPEKGIRTGTVER